MSIKRCTYLFISLLCLTNCASQEVTPPAPAKIINSCRYKVVTYGDALECLVELDEAQYQ